MFRSYFSGVFQHQYHRSRLSEVFRNSGCASYTSRANSAGGEMWASSYIPSTTEGQG